MISVNISNFAFMFLDWILVVFTAYWMFFKTGVGASDDIAYAFYKVFIATMMSGGAQFTLIATIRYWYWD